MHEQTLTAHEKVPGARLRNFSGTFNVKPCKPLRKIYECLTQRNDNNNNKRWKIVRLVQESEFTFSTF